MQSPGKGLFLIVTVLLALTLACSSGQFSEQRVQASANNAQVSQHSTAVAAIVTASKANIREKPSKFAAIASTVNKGDLLSLTDVAPIGPWYQIRDSRTSSGGWIHGNTITLLQPAETSSTNVTQIQRPRRTSPPVSGRSYINVDGVRVPSPIFSDTRPAGTSARCRDGSYSFSQHRRGTCSHHGGVAEWF